MQKMNLDYRSDFPALNASRIDRVGKKQPFIYLDNAATTHKPSTVLKTVESYYSECNANPYRGSYRSSIASTQLYEGSRGVVACFIGAEAEEIVFTRNATESLNLIAYSYALNTLVAGDEIVLPLSEHHSNLVVWQYVCKKTGARLAFLYPDENGIIFDAEIEQKISNKTKIVTFAHVSNVLGTIFPVDKITEHAHKMGAVVIVDCAQSAAHIPLNVKKSDVDFAVFSGHKMYAPMGIGVLFAKRQLLDAMDPFLFGGEMIDAVYENQSTFETGPKRFEAGTPNVAGAIGLAAAIDYIQNIGLDEIGRIERDNTKYLLSKMQEIDAIRILGNPYPASNRTGIVSFTVAGAHPQDVALMLDFENIAIRAGSHCAQPLHRAFEIEASCRVSACFYNSMDEIDCFIDAVKGSRRAISRRIMAAFP